MRTYPDAVKFCLSAAVSALVGRRFLNCLWELTYGCTARCAICNYWKNSAGSRREMSLAEIKDGLERASSFGCRLVNFTGGEPTIRHDLEGIVELASKVGMWTSLVTNGSLLTRERVVALKEAGLDNLMVSLDSVSPSAHDEQRGVPGLCKKVIECLGWVHRDFLTGHRTGGIMFVISRQNVPELRQVMQLAEQLGVYLLFQPYHVNKTGDPAFKPEVGRADIESMLEFKRKTGCILNSSRYLAEIPKRLSRRDCSQNCHAGFKYFSVDPFGYVHPCVDLPAAGHILQNSLTGLKAEDAQQMVRACKGCWYCFRGEADTSLSLAGCLARLRQAVGVVRRNASVRSQK